MPPPRPVRQHEMQQMNGGLIDNIFDTPADPFGSNNFTTTNNTDILAQFNEMKVRKICIIYNFILYEYNKICINNLKIDMFKRCKILLVHTEKKLMTCIYFIFIKCNFAKLFDSIYNLLINQKIVK